MGSCTLVDVEVLAENLRATPLRTVANDLQKSKEAKCEYGRVELYCLKGW